MSKTLTIILNTALYFAIYIIIQSTVSISLQLIYKDPITNDANALVLSSVATSIMIIVLFTWRRWCPVSREYLNTRPWAVLTWTMLAAIGCTVISSLLIDVLGLNMPKTYTNMFIKIMNHELGYFALGIIGPVAEEIVFRGAILYSLLKLFDKRMHWLPIIISALLFGIAHGNMAQMVNATLTGLLLGWMYYHTGSIVPGVVFHWMNNTIAYVLFKLMPGTADMTFTELCGNDSRRIVMYVFFSLCVLIPSLFQLYVRIKKKY